MNVTVMFPSLLTAAFDGRKMVELGVPEAADVGDMFQSLFALYPRLMLYVPNERKPVRQHFGAVLVSRPKGRLLYLFASQPAAGSDIVRRTAGGK